MSRAGLLKRGAVLALAGGIAATPEGDLAYLRLLVGAELLAADFQGRALRSGRLGRAAAALVRRMRADEAAHYAGLARLLAAAGQTPAGPGDIDFSYPAGSFRSEGSILRLAWKLEALSLGAYLGAVASVQTQELRLPIGQIAANESQHLSALAPPLGKPVIGSAFAPALSIDRVSAALDVYES